MSKQAELEEIAAHRRDIFGGGVAPAVVATAFVVFAVLRNPLALQFYPDASVGHAWIVALGLVVGAVALAEIVRLMSDTKASAPQWLRRYAAGLVLLAPAGLILTGRFGGKVADCGSLVDPRSNVIAAQFLANCDSIARHRLIVAVLWTIIACAIMVAFALRPRHRK